jgi:hypothetical protein
MGDMNPQEAGRGSYLLKQTANIYTAMLILAFVFVLIGCLFMFLEMKSYDLQIHIPQDAKSPGAMWSPSHSTMIAQHVPAKSRGANFA